MEEHGTQNPASWGKIAKNDDLDISDIHACRSNTKHVIWLARKTVTFHSWHDCFELLEFDLAETFLGSNSFPQSKKIGWFYWRARFHQGQPDAATGEGSKNMIVDPHQ